MYDLDPSHPRKPLQSHKVHGLAGWFDAYFEVGWFVGLLGWRLFGM